MEIRFSPEEEARLARIAREEGVAPEQLVLEAGLRLIEDDERFRAAVRAGLPADGAGLFAVERDSQTSLLPELPPKARAGAEVKICPVCGYRFKGRGWDGIDAHWRARHEAILPYERAWPLLRSGRYRLRMGRE